MSRNTNRALLIVPFGGRSRCCRKRTRTTAPPRFQHGVRPQVPELAGVVSKPEDLAEDC